MAACLLTVGGGGEPRAGGSRRNGQLGHDQDGHASVEERKGEKHTIIMIDVLLPFRGHTHTWMLLH